MRKRSAILAEVFEKSGSASQLAKLLGITRAAVSDWQKVPIKYLSEISKITGIPRHRLRPDLYE